MKIERGDFITFIQTEILRQLDIRLVFVKHVVMGTEKCPLNKFLRNGNHSRVPWGCAIVRTEVIVTTMRWEILPCDEIKTPSS